MRLQLAVHKSLQSVPLRCQDWNTHNHEFWVRKRRPMKVKFLGRTQVEGSDRKVLEPWRQEATGSKREIHDMHDVTHT